MDDVQWDTVYDVQWDAVGISTNFLHHQDNHVQGTGPGTHQASTLQNTNW